jgi:CRISPR-associated protein Csb2
MVEAFAAGTRFDKHRLWHVEITFRTPVRGPLVIGDGRFLGLGVLAPLKQHHGVYAFLVKDGLVAEPDPLEVARALRRAVMARVQAILPWNAELSTFFSGHDTDGSSARSKEHIAVVFDPRRGRLFALAPHVLGRRVPTREEADCLDMLDLALQGFSELRAGTAGRNIYPSRLA